ncbi:hypothetical protein HNY73_007446 [Argiope bruennichi]|uniref:Uncharacterized protein n=1 Tax=Argiope bruennichi TaxID=94029 RepID=A0A8T0FL10_ARGBR|nr:hypothetical protein HNY73_007446 [Argiope bruennichi]
MSFVIATEALNVLAISAAALVLSRRYSATFFTCSSALTSPFTATGQILVPSIIDVCELHFVEDDFVKEARGFDINTGKVLTAPLGIKKLKEEAFPTIFCGYPNYFQVPKNQRGCSEEKREEREQSALIQAIENSIKENEIYEKWSFGSLEELDLKVSNLELSSLWTVIRKDSYLLFAKLIDSPYPQIKYSVLINEILEVNVFFMNVKRLKVGAYSFPLQCRSINLLADILSTCVKVFEEEPKDDVLNSVKDALQIMMHSDKDPFFQFIGEQLCLKEMRKLTYSPEMLVFCTLLYGLAPNAYQFIRKGSKLILPHQQQFKIYAHHQALTLS